MEWPYAEQWREWVYSATFITDDGRRAQDPYTVRIPPRNSSRITLLDQFVRLPIAAPARFVGNIFIHSSKNPAGLSRLLSCLVISGYCKCYPDDCCGAGALVCACFARCTG